MRNTTININGKTYHGKNISVINNNVFIDGKPADDNPFQGIVEIKVEGDLAQLDSDVAVVVNGDVHGNVDAGNSATCRNVGGNVHAGNSVICGAVNGSVRAGNSVIQQGR